MLLFFPKGKINQVSPKQVRQKLIELFQQWGMPLSIRVDNGMPLGDPQRKSIPELSLWILAKNIEVIFNRPRQPTDNAKVELKFRNHLFNFTEDSNPWVILLPIEERTTNGSAGWVINLLKIELRK